MTNRVLSIGVCGADCLVEVILEIELNKVLEFASNLSYTPAPILIYISIPKYLDTEYDYLTTQSYHILHGHIS